MKADEDPRPVAAQLLDRAIAQLPPGVRKVRCRWDAGYFAADLARHCINIGVEFAIGVKRNTAVVRACRSAPTTGWHPAEDMEHTEVAGTTCQGSDRSTPASCASPAGPGSRSK